MSIKVMYLAKSGAGKSTSYCKNSIFGIVGLNPENTAIINVAGKELSMRKWKDFYNKKKKNYISTKDPESIVKAMDLIEQKNPNIKNIVIDDFQYCISLNFIDKIKDKNGFDKYNDVLVELKKLFDKAGSLREDIIVYILSHVEEYAGDDEMGGMNHRFKAIGQATHKYITPEGLFENVIYGETRMGNDGKYEKVIRVHGTDRDTCKTAPEMFPLDQDYIKNDLSLIEEKIRDYYGI